MVIRQNLNIFEEVKLRLALENSRVVVECNGRIIWKVKRELPTKKMCYDIGIEFIDLKQSDKSRIEKIILDKHI